MTSAASPSRPPTGLTLTPGDGRVLLTWQAPEQGEPNGYNVYRRTSSGPWELIATVTGTSYSDDEVTNGQEYEYKVTGVGTGGEGDASQSVVTTPQSEGGDEEGSTTDLLLFLGIGVLAIAAILALLLVMRRRRQ